MFNKKKKVINQLVKDVKDLQNELSREQRCRETDHNEFGSNIFKLRFPSGRINQIAQSGDEIYTIFSYTRYGKIKSVSFYESVIYAYKVCLTDNVGYIAVKVNPNNNDKYIYNYYLISLDNESIVKLDEDVAGKFDNIEWTEYQKNN